jgi:hypothetical protein
VTPRRFPPPWTVKELEESFVIQDAKGQALAYVYFENEPQRQMSTKRLATRRGALLSKISSSSRACCGSNSPYSIRLTLANLGRHSFLQGG